MPVKSYSSYFIAFSVTIIRYYDYALFGLSGSILAKTFMPGEENIDRILNFFAVFSLAVLVRPAGSLIFGLIGDKLGRIRAIKIATFGSVISTISIALIPSYKQIGSIAVILVIVARMIFLMSLTGEVDGVKIYVAEKISPDKRNLGNGIVSFFGQMGTLSAAFMYNITTSFTEIAWLWRINFLLGGALGFILIIFRNYFVETIVYSKSKYDYKYNSDLLNIININKVKFIWAIVINGLLGGIYHFLIIFFTNFTINVADIDTINSPELIAIYAIGCLISGFSADRVRITNQIMTGLLISLLISIAIIVNNKFFSPKLYELLVFLGPFYIIPMQIKIQSLFPVSIRMRMYSLSHSLGSMIFSSTTPFLCLLIWKYTGSFSLVFLWLMVSLIILISGAFYLEIKKYPNTFTIG